jgi:hypothetical protein
MLALRNILEVLIIYNTAHNVFNEFAYFFEIILYLWTVMSQWLIYMDCKIAMLTFSLRHRVRCATCSATILGFYLFYSILTWRAHRRGTLCSQWQTQYTFLSLWVPWKRSLNSPGQLHFSVLILKIWLPDLNPIRFKIICE